MMLKDSKVGFIVERLELERVRYKKRTFRLFVFFWGGAFL